VYYFPWDFYVGVGVSGVTAALIAAALMRRIRVTRRGEA
jgi:hypothetical protein